MANIPLCSDKLPLALGPYSTAILDDFKFHVEISGMSGRSPVTGRLVDGLEAQVAQIFDNIEIVLSEIGWNFHHIIKARVYLTDMTHYAALNALYEQRFEGYLPARAVVGVNELPGGALLEIECLAGGNEISEDARRKYNLK